MDTVGTFEEDYYPRDPGLNITMLTQWLFESHQPALAAKLLLPLVDKCDDDQQFLDNTAEEAAALYAHHMLNVLAGKRDYAAALDDAHTFQNFYPHTRFSDLADELALELPARDQDFITLTLPNLADHRFAGQFYDPTAGDSFAKSIIWD